MAMQSSAMIEIRGVNGQGSNSGFQLLPCNQSFEMSKVLESDSPNGISVCQRNTHRQADMQIHMFSIQYSSKCSSYSTTQNKHRLQHDMGIVSYPLPSLSSITEVISIPDCAETGASHCDRVNPICSDMVFIFMET